MRITQRLTHIGALTIALALSGCGASESGSGSNPLALIESGVLTACSTVSYPPFEYYEPGSKEPVGSDVEIGRALAEKLHLRLRIVDAPFSAVIPSIKSRRCDFGLLSVFPTEDRLKAVDIVAYVGAGSRFIVRAADRGKYSAPESLSGARVGVLSGAIQEKNIAAINEDLSKSGRPQMEPVVLDSDDAVQASLVAGRIDAMITDSVAAEVCVLDSNGVLAPAGEVLPPIGVDPALGFLVNKSNTALSTKLSELVKQGYLDGTIGAALHKYRATAYLLSDPRYIGKIYK